MDYELFKKLSLAPLSYDSLTLAVAAMKVIQRRYPNFISEHSNSLYPSTADDLICEIPQLTVVPDDWKQYLYNCEHTKLTPSEEKWFSKVKENNPIHSDVVDKYLDLLQQRCVSKNILTPRTFEGSTYYIGNEGIYRPTIIPLQIVRNERSTWAFIVAYSDCIHFYNSGKHTLDLKLSDTDSRSIETEWEGPKAEQDDDSGLYMLLGIRRILEDIPHISQRAATIEGLSNFRVRLLVELICDQLNPGHKEFQEFCKSAPELDDLQDLLHGGDVLTFPCNSASGLNFRSDPPSIRENTSPMQIEAPFHITSPDSENIRLPIAGDPLTFSTPGVSGSSFTRRSTPATSPASRPSPRPISHDPYHAKPFNTMKGILNLLSTASLACRLNKSSQNTSLAILWRLVNEDHVKNKFHQRYNEVLFYNKVEALKSNDAIRLELKGGLDIEVIKVKQEQCKFWKDVCDIGEGFGLENEHKYVSLLAISSISRSATLRKKNEILAQLRRRLNNPSDPLKLWLLKAKELCAAIIDQSLPEENLMIDLYFLKKGGEIDQDTYNCFVSTNPRIAREIKKI